jgi:eukaryotic-like serine/threonine-protein kinase
MIDDLQTALEVEAARAGTTSGEATTVLDAVPPPRRKLSTRARWSWAGIIALLLIAGGALLAVQLISSGEVGGGGGGVQQGSGIDLSSATDFDPLGDGEEHSDEVDEAIDGSPKTTAWTTENYEQPDFAKEGVGIYVEAEQPVAAGVLELRSPDPGWAFEVYAANDPPDSIEDWTRVAEGTLAEERTEVSLDTAGREYRYYLVWATTPADTEDDYGASISDVRLFA